MGCTLVIDTSYGSTVGIVGHTPIVETDSRTHVERLQVNIARSLDEAGYKPSDIDTIVVGVGPAPFTGLRAGIVAAKAIAFATGARLVGQNVLEPQHEMMHNVMSGSNIFDSVDFLAHVPRLVSPQTQDNVNGAVANSQEYKFNRHVTLCVNDARRKQLYFSLNHCDTVDAGYAVSVAVQDGAQSSEMNNSQRCDVEHESRWIDMDIDYPEHIVERVNAVVAEHSARDGVRYVVDVAGHGAAKYAAAWKHLDTLGCVVDGSILDAGAPGVAMFASIATSRALHDTSVAPVEPLYLRRPDAEVPAPLKHVLGHAGAGRRD